jgi:hypothetical protein
MENFKHPKFIQYCTTMKNKKERRDLVQIGPNGKNVKFSRKICHHLLVTKKGVGICAFTTYLIKKYRLVNA